MRERYRSKPDVKKSRSENQSRYEARHRHADTEQGEGLRERKRRYQKSDKRKAAAARLHRKRMDSDPQYVMKRRLRRRLAAALDAHAGGKQAPADQYGIDWQAVIEHLGPCPGSRDDYQIDHIRPLASFDLADPDQVKEAFSPENHRWLNRCENNAKADRIPIGDTLWPRLA